MSDFLKLFFLLNTSERRKLVFVLIFLFFSSIVQFIGITTIVIAIGLLADQGQILNNASIMKVYHYLDFENKNNFVYFIFISSGFAIILATFLNLLNNYIIAKTSTNLGLRIEREIFFYYLSCNYSFFSKRSLTTLVNNIKDHAPRIGAFFIPSFLSICTNLSMLLIILISLVIVDLKVTIFAVLLIFVSYWIFFSGFKKILKSQSELITKNIVDKTKFMFEALSNIKIIKFFNNYIFFKKNFYSKSQNIIKSQVKLTMIEISPRVLMEFTLYFGTLMIIFYYFNSFEKYNLTKIIFFAVASSKALPTVNAIFASIVRYKTAIPSLKTFNEEFSQITKKKLNINNQEKVSFSKFIELKNISFNFEDNSFELSNINLKIKKGEFVGLCGPTGSGKTTIVDLICSVYQPKTGGLFVDDIPINENNADNFKLKISYVSQNFFLGDMTIAELISFGSDQKSNLEEIREVAKISEIDEFIDGLPNKFNTRFGDAGLKLSGGQQQRIAIARALFKKPDILVLDETTGSLDLVTEQKIINNLQNIKKDITIILIAHRVGSLKNCSNIFLMNQGKLAMSGKYDEIIEKSDLFKSLI